MRRTIRTLTPLFVLCAALAHAEPWSVGTTIAPLRLADQHDVVREVGASTRILLVTHDMDGGAIVRDVLASTTQAALDERGVAYVADVSGMPAMVTRLMALPRMRRRPYPVLLDRDGTATRDVPAEADKVTMVRLDALRVTSIEQIDALAALAPVVAAADQPRRSTPTTAP